MDEIKFILDWLFVRGVNLLIPISFYYSISTKDGYKKRLTDRASCPGYHNLWWSHFRLLSDYIKRMCWLITDSYNTAKVAVLCEKDYLSWKIAKPLYQNQIEFNYLDEEAFLSDACTVNKGFIRIVKQEYSLIILEDTFPVNTRIIRKLNQFQEKGGRIICLRTDERDMGIHAGHVLKECIMVSSEEELTKEVTAIAGNTVKLDPASTDIRVSHLVKEGVDLYLLVNEGEKEYKGRIHLQTGGSLELWDAWRG